jgi:hypothetical protein
MSSSHLSIKKPRSEERGFFEAGLSKYKEIFFSSRAKALRRKALIKKISWRLCGFARGQKAFLIFT